MRDDLMIFLYRYVHAPRRMGDATSVSCRDVVFACDAFCDDETSCMRRMRVRCELLEAVAFGGHAPPSVLRLQSAARRLRAKRVLRRACHAARVLSLQMCIYKWALAADAHRRQTLCATSIQRCYRVHLVRWPRTRAMQELRRANRVVEIQKQVMQAHRAKVIHRRRNRV